ncbi:transcriptional regulator [Kocuria dechangensis]|uniref:Transcriptional regulator n=1 Tax=Kocuria dechangensis TaxID=1176249 RepID=A0A917M1L3_9MICC|nr:helix-turn-helix transcriptional regulator [Kocuria dechangensis]GGG71528.1 transcriptional regulator [Kocuria dechangensis]
MLAGVSVDYYTRLERGNLRGVSEEVLEAICWALQLDEAERAHLFALARTAGSSSGARQRPPAQRVRPGVQRVLDAMTGAPAYVRNGRLDVLATNRLGAALYAPVLSSPAQPANTARFTLLDPQAPVFFRDWEQVTEDAVAILRAEAGRHPEDRALSNLIGELSTRSDRFRTRWAAHNVRYHRTGAKRLHHPVVGDLDLDYEVMELPADPGLTVITYTAEPGSPAQDALNLLASWAATTRE